MLKFLYKKKNINYKVNLKIYRFSKYKIKIQTFIIKKNTNSKK